MPTFAAWVSLPENASARAAVERVLACVSSRAPRRAVNPLFLYGPAGVGKSHLVAVLVEEAAKRQAGLAAVILTAKDLGAAPGADVPGSPDAARSADLVVVEDLHQLPGRAVEAVVRLLDRGVARQQQLVFTAIIGSAELDALPARLTSRLAGGLTVGLAPWGPASRLRFLQDRATRRGLGADPAVLAWLADHLPGSGRQLDGALARLETLTRLNGKPPGVDAVAEQFRTEADERRPSVERIVQRVGRYFRVEPEQLQSRRRSREVLLPRQVGMYLARRLTDLSLGQIGAYFGGRDHSTVLHACRKVEQALTSDFTLSGAVRQLHADLI
jgi:chromosomal replication initiator protein